MHLRHNILLVVYRLWQLQVEALLSRYEWEHCVNLQGDCGDEADFPSLQEYARYDFIKRVLNLFSLDLNFLQFFSFSRGEDRLHLVDHFNAFLRPRTPRNYPVFALNYHKLWDNLPAVRIYLLLQKCLYFWHDYY